MQWQIKERAANSPCNLNLVVLLLRLPVVGNNEDVFNFFDLKFRTMAE